MSILKKRLGLCVVLSLKVSCLFGATSVSHNGATFTWGEDLTVGYYAKGEPYVVLPSGTLTLTRVTPDWTGAKHGLMINPLPGYWEKQGFDSNAGMYSSSLNKALSLPLTVTAGSTIVKAISKESTPTGNKQYVNYLSTLTVVRSAPPSGSFRPPYTGSDKTSYFNVSDLDFSALPNLSRSGIEDVPSRSEVENAMDGDLVEVVTNYQGRETRADASLPGYGRDLSYKTNMVALWLCLSSSSSEKKQALINLVQYGIDISACISQGAKWVNDGGHNQGRMVVLAITAKVLNDSKMLSQLDAAHSNFAEQGQTFFVTQADVDLAPHESVNGAKVIDFTVGDIGDPHWGEKHTTQPKRDNAAWGTPYRTNTVSSFVGTALVIRLLGLVDVCDDSRLGDDGREDPFLEYADVGFENEQMKRSNSPNAINLFDASMWDAYRYFNGSGVARSLSPTSNYPSGHYLGPIQVSLEHSSDGGSVYYTLDESEPDATKSLFERGLTISSDTMLRAIAVETELDESEINTWQYDFGSVGVGPQIGHSFMPQPQTATFSKRMYFTPSSETLDCVIALCEDPGETYADMACIVRFFSDGTVDARNGGGYSTENLFQYSEGVQYLVEFVNVDLLNRTYDVYISSVDDSRVQIANGYSFRNEQNSIASISTLSYLESSGQGGQLDVISDENFINAPSALAADGK